MNSIVEFSLLFLATTLVIPAGTVALLYHLNKDNYYCDYFNQTSGTHYALRGGNSGYGFSCGFAYVGIAALSGYAYWESGASLSFKQR